MKNLANCKPSEFLCQTNKIRKSVSKWLSLTKVMEIRKNLPTLKPEMSKEEREKAISEQVRINVNDMLDSILDEYPEETLELLAHVCFVDPKDVDNHPMSEYIQSINELINDEAVIGFFTSLVQLGAKNI